MTRVGIVLGAGGITGEAFHRGVLRALQDACGVDARRADTLVGTSAGALLSASLRPAGRPVDGDDFAPVVERPGGGLPGLRSLVGAATHPWRRTPLGVLATSVLPSGAYPTSVISEGLRRRHGVTWPERTTWIVAVRASDGQRVVFGRPGSPRADLGSAVAASCAIPGVFEAVRIAGVSYVDGGVHSPTNADLLAGRDLDLVVVSSPMSVHLDRHLPGVDLGARLLFHRYLQRETAALRRAGTPVLALEPTPAVTRLLGLNPLRAHRVDEIEDASYDLAWRRLSRANPWVRETLHDAESAVAHCGRIPA